MFYLAEVSRNGIPSLSAKAWPEIPSKFTLGGFYLSIGLEIFFVSDEHGKIVLLVNLFDFIKNMLKGNSNGSLSKG